MPENTQQRAFLSPLMDHLINAMDGHPQFNNPHEAYAVILEEVDELWDEVKKKDAHRSRALMKEEALDIAAAAIKLWIAINERKF